MTTLPPRQEGCRRKARNEPAGETGERQRFPRKTGAGKESRTRDLNLGKVALYQLSYSRGGVQLYHRTPTLQPTLNAR